MDMLFKVLSTEEAYNDSLFIDRIMNIIEMGR